MVQRLEADLHHAQLGRLAFERSRRRAAEPTCRVLTAGARVTQHPSAERNRRARVTDLASPVAKQATRHATAQISLREVEPL